jgi:hypothetical protein
VSDILTLPYAEKIAGATPAGAEAGADNAAFEVIDLSQANPLVSGSERHIFQHPTDAGLLIKVINERERAESLETNRIKRWRKSLQRDGIYRVYKSELKEYISSVSHTNRHGRPVPLARILGLAQTTQGLGMLVEKIRDPETGDMAPTLRDMAFRHGLSSELVERLDQFFADLADSHIIVNDPSARNIVFGVNNAGQSGIFLIDGFGQKQAVPLLEWSKALNRRRVFRKYDTMLTKLRRKTAEHFAAARSL